MLRLLPLLLLVPLLGCPSGDDDLPDLGFDPPVDDRGAGELDFGTVPVGTNPPPRGTIVVTNNTEEAISMGVDCDNLMGTPFNISCPADRVSIPAAGSEDAAGNPNNTMAVGGTLLAGVNDVGTVETTITFDADNTVWTFAITAVITN